MKQLAGMMKNPDEGDEVFLGRKRGNPMAEVPHVESAGAGGGEGRDKEKCDRQPALSGRDRCRLESAN